MNRFFLTTSVLIPALMSAAGAATIGVNFTDSQDVPFGASVAGAPGYEQGNWNFMVTDWSGNAGNDTVFSSLVTSTGAPVTELENVAYPNHSDPVHFDAANTWRSGAGNGDANATLMHGYLDDGTDNQPYVNLSLGSSVTEATIVLYFNGDVPNGPVGRYWLEEWTDPLVEGTVITDQIGISSNGYSGTFVSAGTYGQTGTPSNVDVPTGNYLVFEGITANNIRIRGAGNADPEDFGRGPINAFQVIAVPEPGTSLMAVLSGLLLVVRRKR